jgi:Zn-finger nucleic acid-binding protein
MSIHLCPACAARMTQIGPEQEWRFFCPACRTTWTFDERGQIVLIDLWTGDGPREERCAGRHPRQHGGA